jgi:hypothetical protein
VWVGARVREETHTCTPSLPFRANASKHKGLETQGGARGLRAMTCRLEKGVSHSEDDAPLLLL